MHLCTLSALLLTCEDVLSLYLTHTHTFFKHTLYTLVALLKAFRAISRVAHPMAARTARTVAPTDPMVDLAFMVALVREWEHENVKTPLFHAKVLLK